jgi:TolB protein
MMIMSQRLFLFVPAIAVTALLANPAATPDAGPIRVSHLAQAPQEFNIVISGNTGAKPKLAIPEFSVVGTSAQVQQAAKTISEVLWDDIDFEEEFVMVSRDAAAKIPAATTVDTLPYDRWRELGADAVVLGTVRQNAAGFTVEVQAVGTRGESSRMLMFGGTYNGCSLSNPRRCAHFIADDFHKKQRNLTGVAQTKLAFSSDRQNDPVAGRVTLTESREIYISDYDGANPQRFTASRSLNISPSWSPDGRAIAYISYASHFPDIYLQNVYDVKLTRPITGSATSQNQTPAFSPDGSRIAFSAVRDSPNFNIYVINRDGSNLKRLTTSKLDDIAPSWSPNGTQIVFTSGRTGDAQLYIMSADGTGVEHLNCGEPHCDKPVWSPAPLNKIAYTCGTNSGYDICLMDMTTRVVSKLTDGNGSNEQPSFAPNGRHIVFTTTRWGKLQLAMVDLKGTVLKRRITEIGNNKFPTWSGAAQ